MTDLGPTVATHFADPVEDLPVWPPGDHTPGRILGLDVGHRRIGVAISDQTMILATPDEKIGPRQRGRALSILAERCRTAGIIGVVVGLPYTLHGEIGQQALEILKFVEALRLVVPIPVRTWDERFSTETARDILRQQGIPPDRWKEQIDSIAAAVMLQSYLDQAGRS